MPVRFSAVNLPGSTACHRRGVNENNRSQGRQQLLLSSSAIVADVCPKEKAIAFKKSASQQRLGKSDSHSVDVRARF
jgi:hypothetical protein